MYRAGLRARFRRPAVPHDGGERAVRVVGEGISTTENHIFRRRGMAAGLPVAGRTVKNQPPGPSGFLRPPLTGNNREGCRAVPVAGGRRGRRGFGGPSRNCSPYRRTRAIAGLRRMPTPPRSSTKAHSAAMRRTTSSAVKLGRRDGVSQVMAKFCHWPGALSK